MSLMIQWMTIGSMLLSGLGMGILFDGYRIVSNEFKFPRWSLSVLDFSYWIFSAVFVFRMLYASNQGEVRAYVFIGLALGILLYYWLFSQLTNAVVFGIIATVRWIINFLINIFQIIVITPILWLWTVFLFVINIGTKFTIGIGKIMLQLLLPVLKLLLWFTRPITMPMQRFISPYWNKWQVTTKLKKIWISSTSWLIKLRRK